MMCISRKYGFVLNQIQQNVQCVQAAIHSYRRCSQTRYCSNICSSRGVHTTVKLNAILSPQNAQSSQKKSWSDATAVSSEKSLKQKDVDRDLYQESSLPSHDIQRITPESRRLELKARILFDELSALRGANKKTFLIAVNSYISKEALYRRGAAEFIYAGMQKMKMFGVEKDLVAYKALIQVFPEGKMIPRNVWQVEFMHYPRQQQCGIDLLEQMEHNGIVPDDEFGQLLKDRFGIAAHVTRKFLRMMYWMPKFQNMNPYPVPVSLPTDPIELALEALKRMCVDLNTKYAVYKTEDMDISHGEDTYIVSAQSPAQQHLISKHCSDQPLFVEGPYPVYMRDTRQHYFLLRSEPDVKSLKAKQHFEEQNDNKIFEWQSYFEEEHTEEMKLPLTVHQQEDSTILGLCITGTSLKSSVVSWIRCLEKHNPNLSQTPVLFKLISLESAVDAVGDNRPFREFQK